MELNIESPFSFELGDELFPLPSLPPSIDIPAPQLPSISSLENNNCVPQKPTDCRRRKPLPNASDDIGGESPDEHKKKKIIHRDVERQRRQEMSSLYATLRSLLPLQYVKGKRSICDHMHETVKYIQYMQSKIQELSDKRDELKKLTNKNLVPGMVRTLNSSQRESVLVRATNGSRGVQVALHTSTQHSFPVSIILQALAAEGLEVLSYISTKVNDRFLHTIECQVVVHDGLYGSSFLSQLQHKLTNLEYFPFD